jgi:hypothetical protein
VRINPVALRGRRKLELATVGGPTGAGRSALPSLWEVVGKPASSDDAAPHRGRMMAGNDYRLVKGRQVSGQYSHRPSRTCGQVGIRRKLDYRVRTRDCFIC